MLAGPERLLCHAFPCRRCYFCDEAQVIDLTNSRPFSHCANYWLAFLSSLNGGSKLFKSLRFALECLLPAWGCRAVQSATCCSHVKQLDFFYRLRLCCEKWLWLRLHRTHPFAPCVFPALMMSRLGGRHVTLLCMMELEVCGADSTLWGHRGDNEIPHQPH